MRRAGEDNAVGETGDDTSESDAVGEARPTSDAVAQQGRPYPIWIKVEPAKRRLAPVPPYLSHATWARLTRQIAAYLRQRLNNSLTLRQLVRIVDAEIRLAGGTAADVAIALRAGVTEHPELATLDRTNVVTRRLASEELLERLLTWLDDRGSGA